MYSVSLLASIEANHQLILESADRHNTIALDILEARRLMQTADCASDRLIAESILIDLHDEWLSIQSKKGTTRR